MNVAPAFQGEMMLAGWVENHNSGAKVTFWLPDAEALECFRSMTVKKGNTAGQRFMAVLVEVGDDEKPVGQETEPGDPVVYTVTGVCADGSEVKSPSDPAKKGGTLARDAAMICAAPLFQQFVFAHNGEPGEAGAALYLRERCSVTSRAELDHDRSAARAFALVMADFRDWRDGEWDGG
jgi:hypothetical protein